LCNSGGSSNNEETKKHFHIDSEETCKDSSQINNALVSLSKVTYHTGKPVNEELLKETTIIAYFEDPGFQQALKELLFKPENKELLLKFEQSLPSWTVVLASYTGKYRAWMRHTVRVVCFIASLITLSIACYDLYRNFPLLRDFLDKYFTETHEWLEKIFHENAAAFMGSCLYVAWPLTFVYETLS
jgi:hypothetical protein